MTTRGGGKWKGASVTHSYHGDEKPRSISASLSNIYTVICYSYRTLEEGFLYADILLPFPRTLIHFVKQTFKELEQIIASYVTTVGYCPLLKMATSVLKPFYFPIVGGVAFVSVKTPMAKPMHEEK